MRRFYVQLGGLWLWLPCVVDEAYATLAQCFVAVASGRDPQVALPQYQKPQKLPLLGTSCEYTQIVDHS